MTSKPNSFGFKLGDHFEVVATPSSTHEGRGLTYTTGSIVELARDDGSCCPEFKLISGMLCEGQFKFDDGMNFEYYANLKLINSPATALVPEPARNEQSLLIEIGELKSALQAALHLVDFYRTNNTGDNK